ncbi:hypothetical protein CHOTACABRAS_16 [Bacillus phage Chotacabras]|nr:hypothetical protein CHOTACABRAS_16 [Bacillus phage Chotacabras]
MTRHTRNRQVMKATGDKFFMLCRNREIKNVVETCIYIDKTFEWQSPWRTDDEFCHFVTFAPREDGFFRIVDVKGV